MFNFFQTQHSLVESPFLDRNLNKNELVKDLCGSSGLM